MNFREIQNEIAQKHGYEDWYTFLMQAGPFMITSIVDEIIQVVINGLKEEPQKNY